MKDFKIEESLGFILNKVNAKLKVELLQEFKEYDVTPEQWAILNFLWRKDGVTPKELSDLTFKDKPNTNRILDNLLKKGLITKKSHPTDRRAFQIFLTGKGSDLKTVLIPIAASLLERATRTIDKSKIKEMKIILNQIYNNIS